MPNGWTKYEKAAQEGPWAIIKVCFLPIIALMVVGFALWLVGGALGWFGEAAQVAREEFGPREALRKYEWFKDVSAQLDKKQADIGVYQSRQDGMGETYSALPRQDWPREDREQYNVWSTEVAGVTASYNTLAAEYNAQMAKFNWQFVNRGELPAGATEPLPREYKPYETG
ncbi:hypothetical protein LCGC14_0983470 [marine sediment metagenome]|uniref:Uncharacterized protein n=1 Tax=marine sediment metagenome TaxID=412755 RepID=A0A0F9REK3_9ZZZZ